ncbi:hypothetical protein QJS66_15815 [Kocuria rhizophila]|nr:hypothetical protein QJS66_15815 [Kocuria rhizophila]
MTQGIYIFRDDAAERQSARGAGAHGHHVQAHGRPRGFFRPVFDGTSPEDSVLQLREAADLPRTPGAGARCPWSAAVRSSPPVSTTTSTPPPWPCTPRWRWSAM